MMKVLKRILWILSIEFSSRSLDQTSCLTTAFLKILTRVVSSLCSLFWSMVESPGQKKLRLTKERLTNELRQRTENKLALLKEQSFDRSTDIETKATQCNDRTPCLYACLFCFWLVVVNLLLAQWLYVRGLLKLN
jgi:hypothetical protein